VSGLLAVLALPPAQAQTEERCFPETGYCISGDIRAYWEQHGGLPVFGYPIGPQEAEMIEDRSVQAQWFERNRLELHPQNEPPYHVLLGRLGVTMLERQGIDWMILPTDPPAADAECARFETGHAVCGAFLDYFRSRGLELDGEPGFTTSESLALFGLPISGDMMEDLGDGKRYTVQYFERARFELHPENAPPYNVLLGLLGNEMMASEEPAPTPTTEPAPQPTIPTTPTPGDEPAPTPNASLWEPIEGIPGNVNLQDVFLLNERQAWAIGNDNNDLGVVYRLEWDTTTWSVEQEFTTTEPLNALVVINPENIWAVGNNGLIIHKQPSTGEWEYVENPMPNANLKTLQMFGEGDSGFAGGERLLGDGGSEVVLLRYEDGQWQQEDAVSGSGFINSMHFAPGGGWAVGSEVWRYHSDDNWTVDSSLPPPCEDAIGDTYCYRSMDGVRAISEGEAWVVGTSGANCPGCSGRASLLHYINGAWQPAIPNPDNPIVAMPDREHAGEIRGFNAVAFETGTHGIAVGTFLNPARAERNEPVEQGLIVRYRNGTWFYEVAPPLETNLTGISMADATYALAVGSNGVVLGYGY
jgi:hypothetical protein